MKRKTFTNFIIIFLLLIGIYLSNIFFNLELGAKMASFAKPVTTVFVQTGENISSFFGNFKKIGSLQKENEELHDKLNQALVEIARLSESQKENLALKRDLGFKETNKFNLIAANVTSFDPSNLRDTLTINVGGKDGVKEGNIVISEGFLVGKIINVDNNTSKIRLINDNESAIPANISGSTVTGIVKGGVGNGLTFDQVSQSDKVNMDDVIITSGLGGEFPKGLLIGKVEEIQKISGSIFQSISVRTLIDLTRLERVMIVRS